MKTCILYYLTILANLGLLLFALFVFAQPYGSGRHFALLLAIPALLSLLMILKGGDPEERKLQKRLRKANLRKELKELKEFDS
tara:strand:- start:574 stop:822 length:249 start_codon:yes stop_codon:yes gene_type:complete